MLGGISLATEPLFSRDPEEIVREFQSQAQEGAPLTLVLFPEEWPPHDRPPERLIFSKDSITLAGKGDDKAISFEEAVSEVATAQLLMRRTAGIALAIQRLMSWKGFPSERRAVHVLSSWWHGYDWPDEEIPLQEEAEIRFLAENMQWLCLRGQEVLQRIPGEVIRTPPGASLWDLHPPSELKIQWPSPPQGDFVRTSLAEWLAVPSEQIVRTLAGVARRKGRVDMILTVAGEPVKGLSFYHDGRIMGFRGNGESWRHGNWKENEARIVEFIADVKMSLRRDVVRAATFRHLVSDYELEGAALLLALAEYGFARLDDVPLACRPTIWRTTNLHIDILRNGMRVLEIGGAPPAAGSLVLGRKPKATTRRRGRPRKS
jgi:hypothetical protein